MGKSRSWAWSPLVLAIAHTPLTVLAVPSSVLTLGGGYLFGLHVGFIADSIGATMGATAAFVLGRTPSTFALVYVGTTLKDLSDVTHGWNEFSTTHWVCMALGFVVSVLLRVCLAKVAKALDKAVADNARMEAKSTPSMLPIVEDSSSDIQTPLIITIDSSRLHSERQSLI